MISVWCRIFATKVIAPEPTELIDYLRSWCIEVQGRFSGDDQGWWRAELITESNDPAVILERFLTEEDDIRPELNTWAAWLEAVEDNPHNFPLMRQIIGTQQLITVYETFDPSVAGGGNPLHPWICPFLAERLEGVYQVDNFGFCSAEGKLLVPERAGETLHE